MFADRRSATQAVWDSLRDALDRGPGGLTPHPLFSEGHRAALRAVGAELESLWRGDERVPHWRALLEDLLSEAERRLPADAARGLTPSVLRRIHSVHARHAALGYAWVPRYAEELEGVLAELRLEWRRQGASAGRFVSPDDLTLALFDFEEPPEVVGATGAEVQFRCECGRGLSRPLGRCALPDRCGCGAELVVPVPSLVRVYESGRAGAA